MKCYYCAGNIPENDRKHGLHSKCFIECFNLKNPSGTFTNLTPKSQSSQNTTPNSDISKKNKSFFHGAFKKYSAVIEGEHYILKVAQSEFPELPMIEWVSNKIGKVIGLNVPDFYLIKLENSIDTFVTKNFMASKPGTNLNHIYHFVGTREHNCETLLNIIKEKCGKLADIKEFIYMCLFDALIGNHDRHGRNIALIQHGPSTFSLSPTYDNPSYIGIEAEVLLGADINPTGKISTKATMEPSMKDYILEFNRLGYQEIVLSFKEKLKANWKHVHEIVQLSDLKPKRKDALLKVLNKRRSEIIDE